LVRAQAPELAGEGDQKLVAAVRAAHPGDALVEDAAIEVTVDRRLDVATQIAVGVEETLLIHLDEVLEMVGQSAVEDRVLGTARAIDARTRSCGNRLHPEGRRRDRWRRACGRTTTTGLGRAARCR